MNSLHFRSAALAVLVFLGTVHLAAADPARYKSVRALWSDLDQWWNERDASSFSELFAVDGNFVIVNRDLALDGRAEIYASFAERFPRFAPEIRHATTIHEVREVTPEVCTVDGTVRILRTMAPDVEPAMFASFAIFAVMLRNGDGWQIRELRAFELPAVP
jgi:uncharacterized protein (TIGR02246 family)